MNDKLKNYSTNPDPEVWERIEKSMHRRVLRRQAWTAVAGVAIVALAVVGVVFWPEGKNEVAVQPVAPMVAQTVQHSETTIAVAKPEVETEKMLQSDSRTVAPLQARATRAADVQPATSVSVSQTEGMSASVRPTVASQVVASPAASVSASEEVRVSAPSVSEPQPQNIPMAETTEPTKPSAKATVGYGNEDTILWLPNIFVPGSDDAEINLFRARLNHPGDVLTNFKMSVFNRSGNLVFMSNDINNGWDGKYKGRELPQSAYVYVIYYTDKDGFRHQRKGTVTLVR